jgi:hypothetical protein
MGSPNTLELLGTRGDRCELIIRRHRSGTEIAVQLDATSVLALAEATSPANGESFWLCAVRGNVQWWRFGRACAVLVRAKLGRSRRDVWVPCTRRTFRVLGRLLRAEALAA